MAVSATNRRVPADSMGWATVLLFLLVVALVAAGVVAALVM
jgi:hypothetical protein